MDHCNENQNRLPKITFCITKFKEKQETSKNEKNFKNTGILIYEDF